ncbi:MAG TPA: DUF2946 family protein [Burkholderiaceae bacterium]|nr:DUF2946 family protein [Burkholderiaceae bacterium]
MPMLRPMDASVIAALAKWPDVPAVFGWLSLTARGQWRLRGDPIGNAAIREFIGRNYAGDDRGRWYFQNGPQRVYVSLELTPWVYRLEAAGSITTHTGLAPDRCTGAALLDSDRVVLVTELGPGAIDDRDASRFLRDVSDAAGRTLDTRGCERWLRGTDDAYLSPERLSLSGPAVRFERVTSDLLERRWKFVREPVEDADGS